MATNARRATVAPAAAGVSAGAATTVTPLSGATVSALSDRRRRPALWPTSCPAIPFGHPGRAPVAITPAAPGGTGYGSVTIASPTPPGRAT